MQSKTEMQHGWEFAQRIMGADIAADMGQEYVHLVEAEIRKLEEIINNHNYRSLGIDQLQGHILEEWGAETFNINAVAADSTDRANVLHSNQKNSVDIQLDSGKKYSAKTYATGEKTAKAQARIDPESGKASYEGQERIVPTDQLSDAKAIARREALRNQQRRPDVSDAYSETEARLTDIVQNGEGVSSRKISRKELEDIARESKNQEFKAEEHDITLNSEIKAKYVINQAIKAGYTAAAVTVALQLAPEIYKIIDFLIKNGEIDLQQIKQAGVKGISAGAEGFLRGGVSAALLITCQKGAFGEALMGIDPTALGAVVALVMQTVKNSILVAAGMMDARQMGTAFVDTVVVSGGYLFGARIGGMVGQLLGFELPVMGYLLGSLVGTSLCAVYNIGKKKLISFCVDTGFTCFGLVEQDYKLPDEVLNELDIETIPIPRAEIEKVDIPRTQIPIANISTVEYETINITVLRRGVIGINKIGYVMA